MGKKVTRDEIQKLVGGYATGSLTEAERKLLFDAALEDQELFDQLAHEQVLKELLDEPGAKQRLLTALGPEEPRRVLWKNQWWTIAAATVCIAVVTGVVVLRTPEKPREIAVVTRPAESQAPVVPTQDAAPVTPPVSKPAPVQAKAKASEPVAENAPVRPLEATAPSVPSQVSQFKAEKTTQPAVDSIQPVAVAPPPPVINDFVAGGTPQLQPGQTQIAPPAAASAPAIGVIGGAGGASPAAAGKGGGGRGGGAGGARGFAAQNAIARAATIRFAFDYSFDASGALRIVPTVRGYLSVSRPAQPAPAVLFVLQSVEPGTPVTVQVPAEASELLVSFSATPALVTGASVRRDESAGTVEDQSQRILVMILVKR